MTAQDKVTKRISISLMAGTEPDKYSLTRSAVTFDFIYGIASTGLTPFELALNDREVGESIRFNLASHEVKPFFGSLFPPLQQAIGLLIIPEELFLHIDLLACTEVPPSEIVKAIAKAVSHCGCGSDCDCS